MPWKKKINCNYFYRIIMTFFLPTLSFPLTILRSQVCNKLAFFFILQLPYKSHINKPPHIIISWFLTAPLTLTKLTPASVNTPGWLLNLWPLIHAGEKKRSLGRDYHPLCLKCHKCKRQLTPGQHAEVYIHMITLSYMPYMLPFNVTVFTCVCSTMRSHTALTATWEILDPEVRANDCIY